MRMKQIEGWIGYIVKPHSYYRIVQDLGLGADESYFRTLDFFTRVLEDKGDGYGEKEICELESYSLYKSFAKEMRNDIPDDWLDNSIVEEQIIELEEVSEEEYKKVAIMNNLKCS